MLIFPAGTDVKQEYEEICIDEDPLSDMANDDDDMVEDPIHQSPTGKYFCCWEFIAGKFPRNEIFFFMILIFI